MSDELVEMEKRLTGRIEFLFARLEAKLDGVYDNPSPVTTAELSMDQQVSSLCDRIEILKKKGLLKPKP